jgi:hypothetical protein
MYKKDLTTSAWFLFLMSWLGVFLLGVRPGISNVSDGRDLMEGRDEQLRIFRERRDQFFKQDPRSPLKESDRKNSRGSSTIPSTSSTRWSGPLNDVLLNRNLFTQTFLPAKGLRKNM